MIRNVILDIGDVLVHSDFERFFKKQGYNDDMVIRLSKATFLSPAWRELDRGVWSMDEIMEAFVRNDPGIEDALRSVFRNTEGFVRKYPYAESWIRALKASGLKVYCLSNLSGLIYDGCANELVFLGMVDGYILSWREKLAKPDPQIPCKMLIPCCNFKIIPIILRHSLNPHHSSYTANPKELPDSIRRCKHL